MATLLRPHTPSYDPIDIDQEAGASAYESYDNVRSVYSKMAGFENHDASPLASQGTHPRGLHSSQYSGHTNTRTHATRTKDVSPLLNPIPLELFS